MKIRWLVLIISLAIIITGCTSISGGFGSFFGSKGTSVGGQGVQLTWLEAPRENAEISEGEIVNLALQIDNYVPTGNGLQGQICVRDGLSDTYAGILLSQSQRCRDVSLPKASQNERGITPSSEVFQFGPFSYQNIPQSQSVETRIYADIKYEVDSEAGAEACIKRLGAPAPRDFSQCGQEQNLQITQTDLPIKIRKITAYPSSQSTTESLLNLEIELTKAVDGQVLTRGTVVSEDLPRGTASIDFDVTVNNIAANCPGLANRRLDLRQNENEKVINCNVRISLNQEFIQAPITIKMGYGFIQSKQGPQIKLVKIKGGNR